MPDRMHMLDTGYPNFSGYEKTSEKVDAIQNYLFMLLEELRFLLRNLDLDNFNEQGIKDLAAAAANAMADKNPEFESVITNILYSNTVITNELYANYGEIADLTVWRLRTDYMRARNYLNGNTADINYIDIHDEQISFITASVATPLRTTQLVRDGLAFYWADEERSHMTCVEATAWPVMVYVYDELTKLSIRFETIQLTNGTTTYAPVITLGAGDENGRSKGYIYKRQNDLLIRYLTSSGEYTDISLNDFVDAKHRRLASCDIDPVEGTVDYTVEGDENTYHITFTISGDTVTYVWPDGHRCEVTIPEDTE